jgi:cyanophycinase
MHRRAVCLLLVWLGALAWAGCAQAAGGSTVVIGGALRDDNHAVWQRVVQLAGGQGARIAVLATASSDPSASAAAIVATLQRHGAVAEAIPVAPLLPGTDAVADARDPRWVARLQQASGVFFSGGAQARLVDTLQPGGVASPLLQAIRALHARGGVVAGTSSGAAVLSAVMFRDAPEVQAALRAPLRDGIEVDQGFGFLPAHVVVDQHFVRRGRIARLLPLMASRSIGLGLGVEEDSAAVVQGTQVDVIGSRGVVVVDLADARRDATQPQFNLQGVRLHWLEPGDGFDLATRQPRSGKPAQRRIAAPGPQRAAPALHADLLAPGVLVVAMQSLLERGDREAVGLSFTPGQPLGFEWRLRQEDGTHGFIGERSDQASVLGLRLDVWPVRMAEPLYTPLSTRVPAAQQPP